MNTTASNWSLSTSLLARSVVLSAVLAVASACETVEQDDFISQPGSPGTSPDPTAVIEGTILYSGPPPKCVVDRYTQQRRALGNVVLQLYLFDNPPFPEGNAASSENLLIVSGDKMFTPNDCLADNANPETAARIARSVPFRWTGIALKKDEASYQIRGFYDYDEDFIPLFSVARQVTEGDIMGAAVNDVQEPERGLLKIAIPAVANAINGYVTRGISVPLGFPVRTERPAFKLNDGKKLAATSPYTVVPGTSGGVDALATQQRFRGLTCPGGRGDGISCGLSLDLFSKSEAGLLKEVGVSLDADDASYAFWVQPVDMATIRVDDFDLAKTPDGMPDPHPTLGRLGVDWYTPILTMSRVAYVDPEAKASFEAQARIPQVRLLGSVLLPEQPPTSSLPFGRSSAPMSVPPVAVVELVANRPECRVPYFPPGSVATALDGRVGHCGELPTGRYAVTVVDGLTGDRPTGNPPVINPAQTLPSQQSWTIPNELANPVQVNEAFAKMMSSQGAGGAFLVHSPADRPANGSCLGTPAGLCSGNQPEVDPAGPDTATCLPPNCCNDIAHLCGLPLCETETIDGVAVRKGPSKITGMAGDAGIPNCVPFEMPRICCPTAARR